MADITWTDVLDIAPELAAVGAGAQSLYLAHANTALAVEALGGEAAPKLKLARIYLVAHLATAAALAIGGASGPVVSESAGGLSVSYGAAAAATTDYGSTGYGRSLAALMRTSGLARAMVVI